MRRDNFKRNSFMKFVLCVEFLASALKSPHAGGSESNQKLRFGDLIRSFITGKVADAGIGQPRAQITATGSSLRTRLNPAYRKLVAARCG